jgi:glycosyltransferase involved in cell wall biosynthesis
LSPRRLHVLICNERLLARFGVDRLLLLLADGLRERGHRVTLICQRCDRIAATKVSSALLELTDLGQADFFGAEVQTMRWLHERWSDLALEGGPDIIVTGGWPFFRTAEIGETLGVPVVFIDAGAVPHDGMPEAAAHVQRELRRLRARVLPRFSAVLPISDFIRDSQTLPERGSQTGVETVRLGADHLDAPMFGPPPETSGDAAALALTRELAATGQQLIMGLGRFEAEGYKNSAAAYDVLARILPQRPNVRLLLLAQPAEAAPPAAVADAVLPLGFISDAALAAIMTLCTVGLSMSRWEGFNLPLAEMQWCGRPVLAFNCAAHPEVTADPWFLCGGIAEMTEKALFILRNGLPSHIATEQRFELFRTRFRWGDVIARYAAVIERLAAAIPRCAQTAPARRAVVVDCTNAAVDPANPGVIRVVRRLGQALQQHPDVLPVFARWDRSFGGYRLLTPAERATLATYDGPSETFGRLFSAAGQGVWSVDALLRLFDAQRPPVLFLPEVVLDGQMPERLAWARGRGLAVAALLFDMIPVTHAPLCSFDVVRSFPEYVEGLSAVDAVWAISGESLKQFQEYLARHSLPRPGWRETIWLPAQFGAFPRVVTPIAPPAEGSPLIVLCVGSIEPRKNHRTLIAAFRALLARRPALPLRLVLAGHRFGGADALATWLDGVVREEPRIQWRGLLDDTALAQLFRAAAFTVYPSLVEGYGLPVMESLWMGRPCVCHRDGVMAELAAGGGCLTVDMSDPAELEHAIERLAAEPALRQRLMDEASRRMLLDWTAYGAEIGARLRCLTEAGMVSTPAARVSVFDRAAHSTQTLPERIRAEAHALRGFAGGFVETVDVPVA